MTAIAINLGQWISIWAAVPKREEFLPLHYTIYFGIDLTGAWQQLFLLPAVGSGIILVHLFASQLESHPAWPRVWMLMALVLNILLALALASLIVRIHLGT